MESFEILEKPKAEEKENGFDTAISHLSDLEDFYRSNYVMESRKQDFGISKPEIISAQIALKELHRKLDELKNGEFETIIGNHFTHVMGNSVVMIPGRFAQRFDQGKYLNKPFPTERARDVKKDIDFLSYYVEALSEGDGELLKKELSSRFGHLEDYLDYFCDDIPVSSVEQLKIFKFLREVEKGVSIEEFTRKAEDVRQYLEIEKIKEDLIES